MKLQKARYHWNRSSRALRRARRLYERLIRDACERDKRGGVLPACAVRAVQRGLYASMAGSDAAVSRKDVRWSLLRKFWHSRQEYADAFGWFRYCRDYGWSVPGDATKVFGLGPKRRKAA